MSNIESVPVGLTEFYKACLAMKKGDRRQFLLSEEPPPGWVGSIVMQLANERQNEGEVSLRRSGTTINANCF
jgi:hypothetical protein